MKRMKKLVSMLLTLVMVLALAGPVFADTDDGETAESTYSITIKRAEGSSLSMAGETYNAYKVFDVTFGETGENRTYAYTIAEGFEDFEYTVGTGDDAKKYSGDELIKYLSGLNSNSEQINAVSVALNEYIKQKGDSIAPTSSATAGESDVSQVTIEGLGSGYYIVTGSGNVLNEDGTKKQNVVALCALDTMTDSDIEITLKADAPTITKKIETDDGPVDESSAAIGDTIPFIVTSTVPKMTGYTSYTFIVKDTLSTGLTFNEDVKIWLGDREPSDEEGYLSKGDKDYTEEDENYTEEDEDYTVKIEEQEEGQKITIAFNKHKFVYYDSGEINITYSATVNEDAVFDVDGGNTNTVKLIYSNNPNESGTGETVSDKTHTYVTQLQLIKVNDKKETLAGAEFEIKGENIKKIVGGSRYRYVRSDEGTYYKLSDGTYTTEEPTEVGADKTKYKKEQIFDETTIKDDDDIVYTATTGEDGLITFSGLTEGTYYITEIKAPDGYNKLKESIIVEIKWNGSTKPDDWQEGKDFEMWTATFNMQDTSIANGQGDLAFDNEDKVLQLTISNSTGIELPSTGGIGTTIFYILGGILVVGAGILLITKKRMSDLEN